jgi:hypothetical protein
MIKIASRRSALFYGFTRFDLCGRQERHNQAKGSNCCYSFQVVLDDNVKKQRVIELAPGKFGLKSDFEDGSGVITTEYEKYTLNKDENKPAFKRNKIVNDEKNIFGKKSKTLQQ